MLLRLIPALALTLFATTNLAAPAPYYLWQGHSKTLCAQTSPGYGWTRMGGPYVKSDCSM